MRKSEITALAIVIASFLAGAYLYTHPQMPEMMASHWDIEGDVDGYLPKLWGLFLMPFMSLGLLLLFIAIPKIDPLRENIADAKFRKHFDAFVVLMILFLSYLYALTILWNVGLRFEMTRLLVPAFSGLFFYAGILVENAKRNWFVGIRTPWTLSSDGVWERTHRLGGRLFKTAAAVALLGIVFGNYAFYLLIVPVILVAIYTAAYSYFEYRKEQRKSVRKK